MLPKPVLQSGSVSVADVVTAVGCPMVCEVVPVQVLTSLTVTVCSPVESGPKLEPELHKLNPPPSRLHMKGPVPLVIVIVMLPSLPPLQLMSDLVDVAVTWSTVSTAHLVS